MITHQTLERLQAIDLLPQARVITDVYGILSTL